MKKLLLLLMLALVSNIIFSQHKEDAEKLVDEGITLHDKGDYLGAISKYDKALELDTDNLLALAEKAFSLLTLEKYDESIQYCQKAIEKHAGENALKAVYVTYGTSLDDLKRPEKSIEIYDEGIKQFPDFYLLYFNKGITLSGIPKNDEAILCFQKSMTLNPNHAGSHNALARLLNVEGNRIPSILAFCRFLILEPQSGRAKDDLTILQKLIKKNVKKTGEKSITVSINQGLLDGNSPKENNFNSTDLLLSMDVTLDYDEKNVNKTEVEKFIRKFETICASLKELQHKNSGYYWDYYVPYFIEMQDKQLIKTFAYIAFATSTEPDVSDWLKSHKDEIKQFYDWSKSYNWKTN